LNFCVPKDQPPEVAMRERYFYLARSVREVNRARMYSPIASRTFRDGLAFLRFTTLSYRPILPSFVSSLDSKLVSLFFFNHPKAKMMWVQRSG